jgi:hypothetical protein
LRYVAGDNIPPTVKAWMDANGVAAPVASAAIPTKAPAPAKTAKPATPAGKGLHWKWNGSEWVATKNKIAPKRAGTKCGS